MSPLPVQFTSRWDNRARQSYDDAVCWHLLLGGDPAAQAAAARAATREVLGADPGDGEGDEWAPHLTLCYSTVQQPAAPVIAELGKTLPASAVTISEMSLVVQDGPEDLWNWCVAGSARLAGDPGASGGVDLAGQCG
jgi:hypothetical protein